MRYLIAADLQATGEICPGCGSEVLVSDDETVLLLECDCGVACALGPGDRVLPSAA